MAKTTRTRPPTPRRSTTPRKRGPSRETRIFVAVALVLVAVAALALWRSGTGEDAPGTNTAGGATRGVVGADFHSLVVDPTIPGRLFVGGHQAVSVSSDGGHTWARMSSLNDADAMGWGFTAGEVFVSGHPGINRSTDAASTFRRSNSGLPDTDVHAFGASATTLYAAGPVLGVIASADDGRTWTSRTNDAGQSFFGQILVDQADDQRLVAADARAGAASSTDGGRTWRRLGGPAAAVWVSRSGDTLFASGQTAAKTSDGGATWTNLELPSGATLVEADPKNPDLLYTGVHDGDAVTVWVSRDGGATWKRA